MHLKYILGSVRVPAIKEVCIKNWYRAHGAKLCTDYLMSNTVCETVQRVVMGNLY